MNGLPHKQKPEKEADLEDSARLNQIFLTGDGDYKLFHFGSESSHSRSARDELVRRMVLQ